jgi:competence protein ComEA
MPPADGQPQIVVDVVGKVRKPGIAVLPAGSRVVDAVRAAGGMRAGVDPTTVNLARPLTDGEQVVIGLAASAPAPATGPHAPSSGASGSIGLVNLNTADQAALETLPGVGPVTATAILEWRAEHGGFTSVDELLEVSGIGDATLAEIAPHVTL